MTNDFHFEIKKIDGVWLWSLKRDSVLNYGFKSKEKVKKAIAQYKVAISKAKIKEV